METKGLGTMIGEEIWIWEDMLGKIHTQTSSEHSQKIILWGIVQSLGDKAWITGVIQDLVTIREGIAVQHKIGK